MPEPPNRRQLHGWVTEEALRGWHDFAKANATNVTALFEALGQQLGRLDDTSPHRLPAFLRSVVTEAQQIAGSRSSRRR